MKVGEKMKLAIKGKPYEIAGLVSLLAGTPETDSTSEKNTIKVNLQLDTSEAEQKITVLEERAKAINATIEDVDETCEESD